MRIALNGYGDIATGLGTEFRWLNKLMPFDRLILSRHNKLNAKEPRVDTDKVVWISGSRSWKFDVLDGLDVLVAIERPLPIPLFEAAKKRGIKTVMLTNPEWTPPNVEWLPYCDLFVARTNQALDHLNSLGVGNKSVRAQIPVCLDEFPFRERTRIENIVFLDGWGGVHERKGRPVVEQLLKDHPDAVTIKSQRKGPQVENASDLYSEADVVLVPGRFDGLGLTLLEAMASGCIVAATKCRPYKEFLTAAYGDLAPLIPVKSTETVTIWGQPWTASNVSAESVWETIKVLKCAGQCAGSVVRDLSSKGRTYVEENHGTTASSKLWEAIIA